jgi:hypothetical protein
MAATYSVYLKVYEVKKFFAIKKDICYLSDLGFMFLDNGTRTIRMTIQTMAKAFENHQIANELVVAHPEIFEWAEDPRVVDERYDDGRAM